MSYPNENLSMSRKAMRRISIQTVIMASVFVICGTMGAVATGLQYYFGKTMALDAAQGLYSTVARNAERAIAELDVEASSITGLMSDVEANFLSLEQNPDHPALRLFAEVMESAERVYSIYFGFEDGSLLQLINLNSSEDVRESLGAEVSDRWILAHHVDEGGERVLMHSFLDADFSTRTTTLLDGEYDATQRPWYKMASQSQNVVFTKPYIFNSTKAPGVTYARRVGTSNVVVGVDIALSGLMELLKTELRGTGSDAFLFSKDGQPGLTLRSEQQGISHSISEESLSGLISSGNTNRTLQVVSDEGRDFYVYLTSLGSSYAVGSYFGAAIYEERMLDPHMKQVYVSVWVSAGALLMLLLLAWWWARVIVKQINALAEQTLKVRHRKYSEVVDVPSKIIQFHHLSESLVHMAESIQEYERAQKELMDAIIKLIAEAVDAKSPYTAGHCERVPVLGVMLAEQASKANSGPFKDFALETQEQWREFETAAWLHDCGKISVPEHIVDKGSKLEVIYNRIHEVRMRFEVLWRDAEIDMLRKLIARPDQKEDLQAELNHAREALQEDYAFVAECNVGGEFLSDEKAERLQKIAERSWERNFSRLLGLSPVEELRLERLGLLSEESLPVHEFLLADKPEHVIERDRKMELDERLGIEMEIPEALYNQGELYNLSIKRGTLTAEDRFKINEHMIGTIRMLDRVPFTDDLANVPHFASTHHETLRGDGYPRRLGEDDLGTLDRILAIADIFEALTASDRPYKKAKTLSESLKIMSFMVKDRHIDGELFRLFLETNVFGEYAQQYLKPEQIDEVDISDYV